MKKSITKPVQLVFPWIAQEEWKFYENWEKSKQEEYFQYCKSKDKWSEMNSKKK